MFWMLLSDLCMLWNSQLITEHLQSSQQLKVGRFLSHWLITKYLKNKDIKRVSVLDWGLVSRSDTKLLLYLGLEMHENRKLLFLTRIPFSNHFRERKNLNLSWNSPGPACYRLLVSFLMFIYLYLTGSGKEYRLESVTLSLKFRFFKLQYTKTSLMRFLYRDLLEKERLR